MCSARTAEIPARLLPEVDQFLMLCEKKDKMDGKTPFPFDLKQHTATKSSVAVDLLDRLAQDCEQYNLSPFIHFIYCNILFGLGSFLPSFTIQIIRQF